MPIWIIFGVMLGLTAAALILLMRGRSADLMAGLLVAGIAGLAVVVTFVRVEQYWAEQATAAAASRLLAENAVSTPAPTMPIGKPPTPPTALPILPPLLHPPTGAAAPAAVSNPYVDRSR